MKPGQRSWLQPRFFECMVHIQGMEHSGMEVGLAEKHISILWSFAYCQKPFRSHPEGSLPMPWPRIVTSLSQGNCPYVYAKRLSNYQLSTRRPWSTLCNLPLLVVISFHVHCFFSFSLNFFFSEFWLPHCLRQVNFCETLFLQV